jgi:hypothetical protein
MMECRDLKETHSAKSNIPSFQLSDCHTTCVAPEQGKSVWCFVGIMEEYGFLGSLRDFTKVFAPKQAGTFDKITYIMVHALSRTFDVE